MAIVGVLVTLAAASATAFVAVADLVRAQFVLTNSAKVGVPVTWLTPLGIVKGLGALGLVVGLVGVRPLGIAAATGLTLFFVGAVVAHLRARDHALQFPIAYLVLAASSLVAFVRW